MPSLGQIQREALENSWTAVSEESTMKMMLSEKDKKMNKLLEISEEISKEFERRNEVRRKFEDLKKNKKLMFRSRKPVSGLLIKFNKEKLKIKSPNEDEFNFTIGLEKTDNTTRIKLDLNKMNKEHHEKSMNLNEQSEVFNEKSKQVDMMFERDFPYLSKNQEAEKQDCNQTGKSAKKNCTSQNHEKKVRWKDDVETIKSKLFDEKFLQHPRMSDEREVGEKKNTVSEKVNGIKTCHEEETAETKSLLKEILREVKAGNEEWKNVKEKINSLEEKLSYVMKKLECLPTV